MNAQSVPSLGKCAERPNRTQVELDLPDEPESWELELLLPLVRELLAHEAKNDVTSTEED